MAGGGVAFSQALQEANSSSEPVVKYGTGGRITGGVRRFAVGGSSTAGVVSNTDVGDDFGGFGTNGLGANYDYSVDRIEPVFTDNFNNVNLDTTGAVNPFAASATVLDGNVYNTYGAFGESVPSSVTNQLPSGTTVVQNADGTYSTMDQSGNAGIIGSTSSTFNPRIDVTFGGNTYTDTGADTGIAGLNTAGSTGSTTTDASTIGGLYSTGLSNPTSSTSSLLGPGSTANPSDLIQTEYGLIGTGNYTLPTNAIDLINSTSTPATTDTSKTTDAVFTPTTTSTTNTPTTTSTTSTPATTTTNSTPTATNTTGTNGTNAVFPSKFSGICCLSASSIEKSTKPAFLICSL